LFKFFKKKFKGKGKNMIWIIAFIICFSTLAYQRAALNIWLLALGTFLILTTLLSKSSVLSLVLLWSVFLLFFIPLYASGWRRNLLTSRILKFYRRTMPTMSRTEREALAAGTVSWEGDLFCGAPNWEKLLNFPPARLSAEEQAFLDGPVEELCGMINDWDITHNRSDLPPEVWQFLKMNGFFSLIIPKEFGGKEFSAYAHSQILIKVYGISASVATTIGVPNSLGPAELLLHYGTQEQKNYYLPRLARGQEIPCFALTGPEAGSDAGAMTDTGIICWGEYNGEKVLGIRLNWNKRYITLAPVATVIGLAFKLYDPDHLIGSKESLGITCALIPRETPGVIIGRRHFPCNVAFQNGPTQGKDVFIPADFIIGGIEMAGHGWRMLMECLAAGRAISLPASATGGAKVVAYAAGAYARIRRQFNIPIGQFEGIEEVLGEIGGLIYIMDATRTFTSALIDSGEKPALASAITKYHVTELGRTIADGAMDLHAGKGICLGPNNYLGRTYQSIPIAITVEGANILTRSMIIFGQGAMRCHPYIFAEFEAANQKDDKKALLNFDTALLGHLGYTISNFIRTFVLGLTGGRITRVPIGKFKRYFQQATRLSAAFALLADVSLLVLGGSLKRRENISARLGDIHSHLYLLSAVLKQHQDQGKQADDLPIVRWASLYCLYEIQQAFDGLLKNYPNRWLKYLLTFIIFPWGKHFSLPSDKLSHKVTQLLLAPSGSRDRLAAGVYTGNLMAEVEDALLKVIAAEPIEKMVKHAVTDGLIKSGSSIDQAKAALAKQIISEEQFFILIQANEARKKVIAVDDFAADELMRMSVENHTNTENEIYATSQKNA
jgi:acyl-CoA dehydrogenase